VSLAVAVGSAAIAIRRPSLLSGAPKRALDALRALHNGRLGDYAAWTAAGCAVLIAAFGTLLS
jgi:hypothetical protein